MGSQRKVKWLPEKRINMYGQYLGCSFSFHHQIQIHPSRSQSTFDKAMAHRMKSEESPWFFQTAHSSAYEVYLLKYVIKWPFKSRRAWAAAGDVPEKEAKLLLCRRRGSIARNRIHASRGAAQHKTALPFLFLLPSGWRFRWRCRNAKLTSISALWPMLYDLLSRAFMRLLPFALLARDGRRKTKRATLPCRYTRKQVTSVANEYAVKTLPAFNSSHPRAIHASWYSCIRS